MSQNESIQSQLLDIYDELGEDLSELAALAHLVGEQAEDIDRGIRSGLGGLLERLCKSISEKHAALDKLRQIPEEGGAA
jgi:hypothetical protein